jgi:hypothetical protein
MRGGSASAATATRRVPGTAGAIGEWSTADMVSP